jgi:KipI family sensor histidine kinase inhibitor
VTGFRLVTAGDAQVLVQFAERIDPVVNAIVVATAAAIRAAGFPGVRDVVPTYRSVGVHFDPLHTDCDALFALVEREALAAWTGDGSPYRPGSRPQGGLSPVRVPVCYGGEYGPDLPHVAAFARASEAGVVQLHASRRYRVYMLGFMPGFAYMGTVDDRIAAPRLSTPRTQVPAGSIGIAGLQTGIYPASTPGGWQIIGRTPLRPFDLMREEPFLFEPGDEVEFYSIDPAEFVRIGNAR